jgi:3-oxoadipate enol-lactonase
MEVLYTETQGQGNTLVLLHGFCEDSTVWQWVLPALQKQYAVVTVDLPGFGKSSLTPDKEIETIEDIASRLAYTLTQLGIEKCTLVGHSMGGYVTLAFAERHPERLNGWGLFHSTAYEDSAEKKENRLKQVEFVTKNGTVPFVEVLVPSLWQKNVPPREL